jgi:hypothetical protein
MLKLTRISRWILRLGGIFQLATGLLAWAGLVQTWTPQHMQVGVLFTLAFWLLALMGGFCDVQARLVGLGMVWGLVVMVLGFSQTTLLEGSAHWVIQLLHLLVGVVAMGLGEALAGGIVRARGGAPPAKAA